MVTPGIGDPFSKECKLDSLEKLLEIMSSIIHPKGRCELRSSFAGHVACFSIYSNGKALFASEDLKRRLFAII